MAKGKVVFTGAGKVFENHYNLIEKVAINAKPNIDSIVAELSFLIENPEKIVAIGKQARAFIEKEHYFIKISNAYLTLWNSKQTSSKIQAQNQQINGIC